MLLTRKQKGQQKHPKTNSGIQLFGLIFLLWPNIYQFLTKCRNSEGQGMQLKKQRRTMAGCAQSITLTLVEVGCLGKGLHLRTCQDLLEEWVCQGQIVLIWTKTSLINGLWISLGNNWVFRKRNESLFCIFWTIIRRYSKFSNRRGSLLKNPKNYIILYWTTAKATNDSKKWTKKGKPGNWRFQNVWKNMWNLIKTLLEESEKNVSLWLKI